jgi:hypothetical protein
MSLPSELVDRVARVQLSIPDGKISELRPFFEHRVAGLWAVNVDAPKRQGIAVLYAPDGVVLPPLGLAEAGRRLIAMDVFRDPSWTNGLFYPVLGAGGMTPGLPDYPEFSDRVTAAGELELVIAMDEPALRYAAGGGLGPPPQREPGNALPAPVRKGEAIFTLGKDGSARWAYQLDGVKLGGFGAAAAAAPAAFDAALAIDLLERARVQAGAPRAVLAAAPRALGPSARGELSRVELLGLGPVDVERPR